MIKNFNLIFLTLFYIGKIRYAPGTIASFFTCVIFLVLHIYLSITIILIVTTIIFFYSLFAINYSYETFNSKDPQEIVIDEFVGQMLVLLGFPIYETLFPTSVMIYVFSAFFVFRFFDILKPYPINYIDKNTKGALGVMLDDLVAGLFSILTLIVLFFFLGG